MTETTIIYCIGAFILGILLGFIIVRPIVLKSRKSKILQEAEKAGEDIKKEKIFQAKEKFLQLKSEHEQYINNKNNQIREQENKIKQKELVLTQQSNEIGRKEREIEAIRNNLKAQTELVSKKIDEYEKLRQQEILQMENIAGMSADEAKKHLVEAMRAEARTDAQAYINDVMDEARLSASKEAKRIVINTIQRTAPEIAIENAVTVFNIDNDEIKGRIIGREGRNIRALEAATGVEIVVDDTPEAILLSAFDPVRREVARLALHQLVADGRIHPARIEEVVEKVKKQLDDEILETGKRTCIDLGIHGLNLELVKLVGRMKYRSSYGQNLLQHS
ncbi:MAG: DUF3552 domain-containing protein, partial [Bacteroidales bacterium]|nr:DUF3552 domain-containing protein [Bacteroidales bacterium]